MEVKKERGRSLRCDTYSFGHQKQKAPTFLICVEAARRPFTHAAAKAASRDLELSLGALDLIRLRRHLVILRHISLPTCLPTYLHIPIYIATQYDLLPGGYRRHVRTATARGGM